MYASKHQQIFTSSYGRTTAQHVRLAIQRCTYAVQWAAVTLIVVSAPEFVGATAWLCIQRLMGNVVGGESLACCRGVPGAYLCETLSVSAARIEFQSLNADPSHSTVPLTPQGGWRAGS